MATFIVLGKYTAKGIGAIKESPQRVDNAKKAAQGLGGNFKEFYLTMGQYDFVAITDLPDDETAAKFALQTGMQGNVTTETLRAFPEAEFRKIIGSI
jgi:uncharacterized protein with GYD domain